MKYYIAMAAFLLLIPASLLLAQDAENKFSGPGTFSVGTRNSLSVFNDDQAIGKGIGGQVRMQFTKRLNSEWFFDYLTSKNQMQTIRNDYHLGWSLLYYPFKNVTFENFIQPYLVAGHCFDYSKISAQKDASNFADRWSMAAQAGFGTHLNFTRRFDCSLSSQYMLHFGKEIVTSLDKEMVLIEKKNYSSPHGHLLFSISFNYKLAGLWKGRS